MLFSRHNHKNTSVYVEKVPSLKRNAPTVERPVDVPGRLAQLYLERSRSRFSRLHDTVLTVGVPRKGDFVQMPRLPQRNALPLILFARHNYKNAAFVRVENVTLLKCSALDSGTPH